VQLSAHVQIVFETACDGIHAVIMLGRPPRL
jgi:hypothetical protein